MHLLVRQLEEINPELLAFPGELPHVEEATRISLRQIKVDVNQYNTEMTMLQGQVQASAKSDDPNDKFHTKMKPFASEAAEVMDELKQDLSSLETLFTELVTSFGEDVRKLGTEEFFQLISEFVEQFKRAYRQNQTPEFTRIWDQNRTAMDEEAEEKGQHS